MKLALFSRALRARREAHLVHAPRAARADRDPQRIVQLLADLDPEAADAMSRVRAQRFLREVAGAVIARERRVALAGELLAARVADVAADIDLEDMELCEEPILDADDAARMLAEAENVARSTRRALPLLPGPVA